jgi:Asp-tRNAAsn/Glu-tRNAGln amidotransferase A subunit and related amidases
MSSDPADPLPEITPEHIAAAETLSGRVTTDAHRALMCETLPRTRRALEALRCSPRAEGEAPALRFSPLLPGADPARLPAGRSRVRWRRKPLPAWNGRDVEDLAFASASDLARLLRAGRVTSRALTEMYLDRLKRFGPGLHCVVNRMPDDVALAAADRADREIAEGRWRGPLHGIPYGAKDLFAARGLPTTWGVEPYRDRVIDEDATVIRRLTEAGAVLVAKLSMGELAMGDTWFGGLTRTPWNPEEGSSGSSAGSGSATAAGLVGFALGTETYGSIISPCVACGVTGLRPTFGRVSRHGAMPLSWSMDKVGPMARAVEDCALVFDALRGPDGLDATVVDLPFRWEPGEGLEGLRVGLDVASWEALKERDNAAELLPVYEAAVAMIERQIGAKLTPVTLPERCPEYDALPMTIIGVEATAACAPLIAEGGMDRLVQQGKNHWPNLLRVAATIPAAEYIQAQRVRSRLQREMAAALEGLDAYVTVPGCGPSLPYTNLTGHPEVVIRCGRTPAGTPLSLSCVGALYREDIVLRLAGAFERATDWHRQWPELEPVSA